MGRRAYKARLPGIEQIRRRCFINRHPVTVGRGPVPRHRSRNPTRAGDRPPRYGEKWETLSLAIVRARQRARGTGPRTTMKKTAPCHRRARACPSPVLASSNARGGQAPALRAHQDQEGSPTGMHRWHQDREGSPTVLHRNMKHPQIRQLSRISNSTAYLCISGIHLRRFAPPPPNLYQAG